ncbi:MAG TPA: TonB-dependent receptor [Fulvivirga sp.]|nr:TonB-dependent receptor [Fulvivirga sp.]
MRAIAVLALVVLPFIAKSQNSFKGTVSDESNNELLFGATIYITDLKTGSATDMNGHYEIGSLPTGKFLVEIRFVGYAAKSQYVQIAGETIQNFKLSASATELNNVVITGVSVATEARQNPVATSFVDKEELESSASTNIVESLASKPGITQISTGPAIGKPVIRGLGYNRIVTLNNNIKQEGQQWGDEHGIEIDEYSIDKVEIIKGPGSLMYGSDAMAGVINFLPPNPVNLGKIVGEATANYQTNNQQQGYSLMNAGNKNGINWRLRSSYKLGGNFKNPEDGKVYNSGYEEFNVNGYVGINKKWGYSHLNFSRFAQKVAIPEGERDAQGNFIRQFNSNGTLDERTVTNDDLDGYQIDFPHQKIHHYMISTSNNFIIGDSRLSFNLGYQQNLRDEFANPIDPNETELSMDLKTISYDAKYHLHDFGEWETTVGFSGQFQNNTNNGVEYLIPDYDMKDIGFFAVSHSTFEKFNLSGGLRYDIRQIKGENLYLNDQEQPVEAGDPNAELKFQSFDKSFSNLVGSIGLSHRVSSKFLWKLNVSRGFRAPNIAELGSNGEHEGTFRYELGNSNLSSETSTQTDLGLDIQAEHVSIILNGFTNIINDYIYLQKLTNSAGQDSLRGENNAIAVYQYTQGNALLYGGEFMIDLHPHPLDWLHFENSFAMTIGKLSNQPDSMKYTPFQPAPTLRSELRGDFKNPVSGISKVFVKLFYEYKFDQNRIFSAFNTETETPAYGLLGIGIGADFVNRNKRKLFSLYLTGNNLTDEIYQDHLSRLKYGPINTNTGNQGIFNAGRNVSFKLVVPLTF